MKINTDQILQKHSRYIDYDGKQFIVELDILGESIIIVHKDINGKRTDLKEFTKTFINTHINCQWQDKGTKQEIQP